MQDKQEKTKKWATFREYVRTFKENYRNNKAFQALIKLSLYFLFFFVIILVVSLNTEKYHEERQEEPTTQAGLTYKEILNNLLVDNCAYHYEITSLEEKYLLDYKINAGILNGILESSQLTTKIKIQDNNLYEIKLKEEVLNNDLVAALKMEYLNIYTLVDILNNSSAFKALEDNVLVYNYVLDAATISVRIEAEKVISITINDESTQYIIRENIEGEGNEESS